MKLETLNKIQSYVFFLQKYPITILFIPLAFTLNSCIEFPTGSKNDTETYAIAFGDNIEGVKIWDDSSTVIKKLGKPSDTLFNDLSIYTFEYKTNKLNYSQVTIVNTPILGYGVINISVEAPYQGKSKEGIGIGSRRSFVINNLGTPKSTQGESPNYTDTYDYRPNFFSIEYENDKIKKIRMFVLVE